MATATGNKKLPRRSLASQTLFKALGKAADKIAAQTAWRVRKDKREMKNKNQELSDYEGLKRKCSNISNEMILMTKENKRLSDLNVQLNDIIREKTNFIEKFVPVFHELSKELQEMLELKNGEIENWKRVANVGLEQVEKLRGVLKEKEEKEKEKEKRKKEKKEKIKEIEIKELIDKEKEKENEKVNNEKVKEAVIGNEKEEKEKEKEMENKKEAEENNNIDKIHFNIWEACQKLEKKKRESMEQKYENDYENEKEIKYENEYDYENEYEYDYENEPIEDYEKVCENEKKGKYNEVKQPPEMGTFFPVSPITKKKVPKRKKHSHENKYPQNDKKYERPTLTKPLTYEQEIALVKNEIRGIPAKNFLNLTYNPESDSDEDFTHSDLWKQIIGTKKHRKKKRQHERKKHF